MSSPTFQVFAFGVPPFFEYASQELPRMSEVASLSAPDSLEDVRLAVRSVTACVSSCASTSRARESAMNCVPLSSPYTIFVPFEKALVLLVEYCADDLIVAA